MQRIFRSLLLVFSCFALNGCGPDRWDAYSQNVAEKVRVRNDSFRSQGRPIRISYLGCNTNSVGGSKPSLSYYNTSGKTIKYLRFQFAFYNSVGDPAICEIRGLSQRSARITGPIESNDELNSGSWDPMIYDHSSNKCVINNLEIQYMDGSKITYNKLQVSEFILENGKTEIPPATFFN